MEQSEIKKETPIDWLMKHLYKKGFLKESDGNEPINLMNQAKKMKTKMTTQEKAKELVQDLGVNHAIYVTEEVIAILEDWEGTELAQNDWVEIEEIIRSMKKLTFKPYKEQILVQSSIDGEVIWEDKEEQQYCIVCGQEFDYDDECPTGHVQK